LSTRKRSLTKVEDDPLASIIQVQYVPKINRKLYGHHFDRCDQDSCVRLHGGCSNDDEGNRVSIYVCPLCCNVCNWDGHLCSCQMGACAITTPRADCVSGEKYVTRVIHVQTKKMEIPTKVKDLSPGMIIKGLDEMKSEANCNVLAIGRYLHDTKMYGGYTPNHVVFDEDEVVPWSVLNDIKEEDFTLEASHDVLTDCPLTTDVDGVKFSGIHKCGQRLNWEE